MFVDCGGHNGSSVRKFRATHDENADIVTFEPNPRYAQCYRFEHHELIPAAVWIEDSSRPFYLDPDDGDGSTLLREKTSGVLDREHPIQVATVDLSRWLSRLDRPVILKLDIEGAEYAVLDKILTDGTHRHIHELLIEWHWHKVGVSEETHLALLERWTKTGIPVANWDANGW